MHDVEQAALARRRCGEAAEHAARRRDHGDAGARAHHAGHHPRAVRRGRHRVGRAHQRHLRRTAAGAGGGRARFHAPVQRHVAAHLARARRRRRGARARGQLVSGSSSTGITCIPRCCKIALARQAARPVHAGERRDAERRRGRERVSNPGPPDHRRRRPDRRRRRPARRRASRHGERRAQYLPDCSASRSRKPCAWPAATRRSS